MTAIPGATSQTYTLTSADVGQNITCTVIGTNSAGSANGTSNSLGPVTALPDSTPDAFSFTDVTGAALSTLIESNVITVAGINVAATLTVTGGEYSINGGAYASASTTVVVGNTVKVRGTSSGSNSTAVNVVLAIGGVSDTFTITTLAAGGSLATPTLTSLTTATDSGASSTDNITNDTTPDINVDWGADPPLTGDVIEVRNGGTLIVTHTVTAGEAGSGIVSLDFPLSAGSNSLTVTHKRGATASSPSGALVVVIDTTAPTLSAATAVKTGITTATLGVTTNDATGTLYGVLTLNSTPPTAAQIKAGQNAAGAAAAYAFNQAVSTTTQSKSVTGLTGGTAYYAYYMQEDVAGNQSTIPTGVTFTTDSSSTLTWDPARKNAGITLSNGNLTATTPANAVYAGILASGAGQTTGKYYFEVTITTMNPDGQGIGFGNASSSLTGQGGTTGADSIGWRRNGSVCKDNAAYATIQTFAQGDVVAMAVDLGAKLVWFRNKTGGTTNNWNNSGTANPATGTGGISGAAPPPALNAGPYFPMATLEIAADSFTANFGATAYAMTVPSGFLNWDGSGGVPDTTAPTLTSPTAIKTGSTTAMLGVTTDETNGTLYGVLTLTSSTPTKAQIKAGQNAAGAAAAYAFNQAVSITAQSKSATGLTVSTTYFAYYMHEDAAGNQSNIPTVASFTTDATGFNVLALPGLIGWYDASVGSSMKHTGATATNGQTVDTWNDQSPAGNHLTVAGGNLAPVLNTTGMNTSFPTLVFTSASGMALTKTSYAIGTGNTLTAFVVARMDTGAGNYVRLLTYTKTGASVSFDNIGSAAILVRDVGNNAINSAANSVFCTPGALALDTPAIIGAIYTGSVISVYVNNVRAGTGNAYTGAFVSGGKLQICTDDSGASWNGRVSEVIICNANNTADATNIFSYLQSKWGL